jgi:cell division protein FtsQ
MKKRLFKIFLWVVSIVIFLVLTGIVVNKYGMNKCRGVQITIHAPTDGAFLTQEDVKSYISESGDSLTGADLSKINIEKLESIINQKPYVLSSKVYMSLSGILKIDITERTPIARVQPDLRMEKVKNYGSYYITSDGRMIPVEEGKVARVVFVNGKIRNLYSEFIKLDVDSARMAEDTTGFMTTMYTIYHVADYISKNSFLKAQIQQIFVAENDDLIFIPEVGDHIIIFGDGNDMANKFRRIELFYEKAAFIKGWDKYDTINVKFKNQIICS